MQSLTIPAPFRSESKLAEAAGSGKGNAMYVPLDSVSSPTAADGRFE